MNEYQEFIALSRYARWIPESMRREQWQETVARYITFISSRVPRKYRPVVAELEQAILDLEVMGSMRAMMTAGPALERDNVAGFNCSYLIMNRVRAFDELMYILLCGTGVGFSCERDEVKKLPEVAEEMHKTDTTIVVADSKIGWASAFRELVALLYAGKIPTWDVSRVRPAGAPLKTFGGRASGPEPLVDLFNYTVALFRAAVGRQLTSIEVHGLVCKIAEIVVVGGVRRSALISLSSFSDDRMRHAKSGQWWMDHQEYALSNNSVAYTAKPEMEGFMREWLSLVESKSGERGIFNRVASQEKAASNGRRDGSFAFGTNPCSEIILRDRQFCNLSEVVVRNTDTVDDLKRKVRLATILGTIQSTLTDFRYLSAQWQKNTEEERLLGVSLTGIMDHPTLSGNNPCYVTDSTNPDGIHISYTLCELLEFMKDEAIRVNKEWAKALKIPQSTAITCVKPSGTVSQLVDSASGIHPRHSAHYIRTVRADKKDPVAKFMVDAGFPHEDDVTKPDTTLVFSFPQQAPEGATCTEHRTAIEQLEHWLVYARHWCEHKPSVTINVKEHEWLEVGAWVYAHFDEMSGVSFLPYSEHTYQQAPYQEITKEEYDAMVSKMPEGVDWSRVSEYETEDRTIASQELACTGNACEITDLV